MSTQTEAQHPQDAINAAAPAFSPLAEKLLKALQALTRNNTPHPCGGFTTCDMQWMMASITDTRSELLEALSELEDAKLIRYAGDDEEAAHGSCWELRIPGPAVGAQPAIPKTVASVTSVPVDLYATIKKSSKYYGQDHARATGKPSPWLVRFVDSRDSYGFHGNGNQYRREDLTFWVKATDGTLVKLS
ncbi:MAG: hypothetical protein K0R17_1034 [Rariglobus sp.]|jgi:hypothetical protein|nr:hypothetical protein [Rariglobus sp.]